MLQHYNNTSRKNFWPHFKKILYLEECEAWYNLSLYETGQVKDEIYVLNVLQIQ